MSGEGKDLLDGIESGFAIQCDVCDHADFEYCGTKEDAARSFAEIGWELNIDGDICCPDCRSGAK